MYNPYGVYREILRLLQNDSGMTGHEMIKASTKLSRWTIYTHLAMMEDKGWLRHEAFVVTGLGLTKRRYFITNEGKREYDKAN
jgi:DNA-binding PadR family transcriptional regulator